MFNTAHCVGALDIYQAALIIATRHGAVGPTRDLLLPCA